MNHSVELERIVFGFGEDLKDRQEDKLLLIKENTGDEVRWRPLAKGWEYNLWYCIGERGGLAEAEEISIVEDGKEKNITIEEYVALYQNALENVIPVRKAMEQFSIQLHASRTKECSDKYAIKVLEEKYKMTRTHEDNERYYYKKDIDSIEDLANVGIDYDGKEHSLRLLFEEKIA